jgi:deoxyadenosine/deoxycytidine kinase
MAIPYVVVIGNICSGKSTFINQFSACHEDWYSLPEVLSESQRSTLRGPNTYSLYAAFFTDFYIDRHLFSRTIPGPMIQESCLESSSLYPAVYYQSNCIAREESITLEAKYAKYINELPRPDFYIYLYTPQEMLLTRAEYRKEPARTVSKILIPPMQDRLEDWVGKNIDPEKLFKINSQDVNMNQIDTVLQDLQRRLKHPGNHS